jgi:predicted alpha/beta hydrolase family esterase
MTSRLLRLPLKTIVVASTDDQYVTAERARYFAGHWGSRIEFVGAAGHFNAASGLGSWPGGFAFLRELMGSGGNP